MSEAVPTPADTVEAVATTMVDAVSKTAATTTRNADAIVQTAAAPIKSLAAEKRASAKKPAVAKAASAPAKRAPAKRGRKPSTTVSAPVAQAARTNRKAATAVAKRKYVRKAAAPAAAAVAAAISPSPRHASINQGMKIMDSTNWFAGFNTVPGADKFQSIFADAGEKSQSVVRKGQAFAETMTETARANMEAVVESTRIAAAGARDLGQELVASTKGGVEHATTAVKSLTEAKSPTEFFQLQSEMVRASFDRMVAEGSKITEQMVKLAGEAAQPLSSRASVNAEKFNELTA